MQASAASDGDDLDLACKRLLDVGPEISHKELEKVIEQILEASRDPDQRSAVSDGALFMAILTTYKDLQNTSSILSPVYRDVLKCICNLSSDSDSNRQLAVSSPDCLRLLHKDVKPAPRATGSDAKGYATGAQIAIATLYNICKDYPPAKEAYVKADIHGALALHISERFKDHSNDELDLSLAVELWSDITGARGDEDKAHFDEATMTTLFEILHLDISDDDTRREAFLVVAAYFLESDFQHALLRLGRLFAALDFLDSIIKQRVISNNDLDFRIERLIAKGIAEASLLPDFPDLVCIDDKRLAKLYDTWLIPDENLKRASLAVCSCILLANLAINEATTLQISAEVSCGNICMFVNSLLERQTVPRDQGVDNSEDVQLDNFREKNPRPAEKEYLHAVAGFLRRMASPLKNRQEIFVKPPCLETMARLIQYPDTNTQVAGLKLYKRCFDPATWTDFPATERYTPVRLYRIIRQLGRKDELEMPTKLELGSIYLCYTRALVSAQKDNRPSFANTLDLDDFVPLFELLVSQKSAPLMRAEGWLGLALMARLPSGAKRIATRLLELETDVSPDDKDTSGSQKGLMHALKELLDPSAETKNNQEGDQEQIPEHVRIRQRDNVLILLHDLLKSTDLDGHVRTRLQELAAGYGMKIVEN